MAGLLRPLRSEAMQALNLGDAGALPQGPPLKRALEKSPRMRPPTGQALQWIPVIEAYKCVRQQVTSLSPAPSTYPGVYPSLCVPSLATPMSDVATPVTAPFQS